MNIMVEIVIIYVMSVILAYIVTKNAFKRYVTFAELAFAIGWFITFPVLTVYLAFHAVKAGMGNAKKVSEESLSPKPEPAPLKKEKQEQKQEPARSKPTEPEPSGDDIDDDIDFD